MTHLCEAALAEAGEWWATLSENEKEGRREHAAEIVNLPELLESSRLWHRCLSKGKPMTNSVLLHPGSSARSERTHLRGPFLVGSEQPCQAGNVCL